MEWKFSEEQDAYAQALNEWLGESLAGESPRAWYAPEGRAAFEEAFRRDWSGVGVAEDEGGQGGGLVELALTAEELSRAGAPAGEWLATILALPALAGNPGAIEEALGGRGASLLVPAEQIPAEAHGLPRAGGTVSATVPRVLAGDTAGVFVVPVQGAEGVELHVVDGGQGGVSRRPRRLLDKSRSMADVVLDGVRSEKLDVDAAAVLEDIGRRAAVLVAADALGASERMLGLAVEYSKQRQQFGVQIGSFQAVKHAAATIMVGVEAARSAVFYTAASVAAAHPEAGLHAAATKAQVTAEASRAADSALTLHGAIGYTWEHDLHLYYKRARLDESLFGTPDAWNERLADALQLA